MLVSFMAKPHPFNTCGNTNIKVGPRSVVTKIVYKFTEIYSLDNTGQQKSSFSFKREQEHSFMGNIETLILNLVLVFF